jgi:hypothetical protein
MAMSLSALRAGRPHFTPRKVPGTQFLLEPESTPEAILQLERLGQFKNPMISSGIEAATFRLVAQCLNQLRYHAPPICFIK